MEDMSIVYEAGRQYFGGHISLSISGDSMVELQYSQGEQKKNYQGLLSKDGLSSLSSSSSGESSKLFPTVKSRIIDRQP